MSKTLAIKGRETQGIEVIKLLEMMGGKNCFHLHGLFSEHAYYFIGGPRNDEIRAGDYIFDEYAVLQMIDDMCFFTLEEFWEKFPFKVGDRVRIPEYESEVRICQMKWDPLCEYMEYMVYRNDDEEWYTAVELLGLNAEFLVNREKGEENGKMLARITLNHLHTNHLKNVLSELYEHIKTTPKEELEKEFKEIEEWSNVGPTVEEFMTFCESVNKKPKYPTTYEECCDVLGCKANHFFTNFSYNGLDIEISDYEHKIDDLLQNFRKLRYRRDAYWKIAGEQMGLGKPWEPDWNDHNQPKFGIHNVQNNIHTITLHVLKNLILVFPTVEMRDAFYENFKDLIENCKELL